MSTRPGYVGATTGLVVKCSDTEPEQVYVFRQPDVAARPIRVEGWKGYSVPMKMQLTRRQTYELIGLLARALAKEDE